jgi:hypothetical protein
MFDKIKRLILAYKISLMFIYPRKHWAYFKYLARHKWFVFVATRQTGCSLWRGVVHDLSKFNPMEWKAYANAFYANDGSSHYKPTDDFDAAWLHHQHKNLHHWQYWILCMDDGRVFPIDMPDKYVREMVADWMGAGKAITGKWEAYEWYNKNRSKITLSPKTESDVDVILDTIKDFKG